MTKRPFVFFFAPPGDVAWGYKRLTSRFMFGMYTQSGGFVE